MRPIWSYGLGKSQQEQQQVDEITFITSPAPAHYSKVKKGGMNG